MKNKNKDSTITSGRPNNKLCEFNNLDAMAHNGGLSFINNPFGHIACLAFLVLVIYANSFDIPFQWDDITYVIYNPIVKNLHYFTNPEAAKGFAYYNAFIYRYIGYLTFALNYKINGSAVTGYHAVNIAIHIANTVLVYFLVLLSYKTPFLAASATKQKSGYIAMFSSLLFAVHPLQTEVVAGIFQRFVSLATFFYLLSLTMYIKSRLIADDEKQKGEFQRILFYAISLFSAVLAMKTTEIAFTLPLTIILNEFCFFRGSAKTRLLYLTPMLLTLSIIPLTLIRVPEAHSLYQEHEGLEISRWHYLFTEFRVIVTYLRLLIFPFKQVDYEYPLYKSFFNPQVILSFMFLVTFFGLGVYMTIGKKVKAKSSSVYSPDVRLIGFGILWFFITLSVESSVIPLFEVINEYRVYLPSIGPSIGLVTGLFLLKEKVRSQNIKYGIPVILVIAVGILSATTYIRNDGYKDDIKVWEGTVRRYPARGTVHVNLGVAYQEHNMFDKAKEQYLIAIKLSPDLIEAHNNLGNIYNAFYEFDKAIEQYMLVLGQRPDLEDIHYDLGLLYYRTGQTEKARVELATCLKMQPDDQRAKELLDRVLRKK